MGTENGKVTDNSRLGIKAGEIAAKSTLDKWRCCFSKMWEVEACVDKRTAAAMMPSHETSCWPLGEPELTVNWRQRPFSASMMSAQDPAQRLQPMSPAVKVDSHAGLTAALPTLPPLPPPPPKSPPSQIYGTASRHPSPLQWPQATVASTKFQLMELAFASSVVM